jgi:autotransporter-associated beta strand protein
MVRMHEGFDPMLRHLLMDQMHMKMSNRFSQACKSVFTLLASVLFMGSVAGQTLTISTGTSSGSGWSISSGTLTVTANSTVNVSAITTALGSGSLSIVGNTTTFAVTVSTAITSSTAGSGLTIGSSTNTGNITFGAAVSVNGSLTVYGGTISLGANLSSTGGGDISIYSDAALAGLSASRTMSTTGSFKYLPRSTSFSASTSIPISNLAFSNIAELQLGKSGNTSAITFASNISVPYAVTAYGGAITMTGSITTTSTTNGNVSLNGTTISGSGNMVIAGGRTATINISQASTYSGVVSGTLSSLTKAGVGSLTLDKNQTYTGATTISGGSLQLNITSAGGNLASASDVEVQSGAKLTFRTALKVDFPNDISGTGGIDFLSVDTIKLATVNATAATIESNSNVLDVMQRITGATQFGASCTTGGGEILSGANFKLFDPVANKGYVQFQQRNLDDANTVCVFALVEQSGTNVQVKVNTTVYGTGACTIDGSKIGQNNSTGGTGVALATINTGAGVGIRKITMSGMVYFTGSVSLTGAITTLSSNLSSNDGNNAYTKNSIGAFGITGSTLPAEIANSGLFSINASSALTLSGSISSGGVTIQRGEAVTLTGSNTFSGTTIIDGGKSMTVGDGGTSGSISGNIQNYGSLTFNRSDALTYTGAISGSGTLTKSGAGTLTMTGASTYTGSTTINAGTLVMQRNAPTSGSSGFSGAGALVIEPSSASFTSAVNYPITGFTVSSSIGGLTVGKLGNTANITLNSNVTAAGPLTFFGGTVTLGGNLSTTTSDDISIYSRDPLAITGSRTVTTTGLFKYMPTGTSFASAISYPVSNLTVTSNGLQLGKSGNTAALTITGATSSNGPVTVYTGDFTTNASATLTATASALEVNASGSVTLNAALAGSTTTVNGQGNVQTTGSLTNLNLSGGSAQSITGAADLRNLTLNKSAGTATVSAGPQNVTGVLTLTSGTLAAGGYLTLKSTASATARVASVPASGASITGNVTVERYLPSGRKWRLLTAPLTGSSNNSVYYNWQNNGTVTSGTGVEVWGPVGSATPSTGNGLQTGPNASMRSYGSGWADVTNTKTTYLFDGTTNYGYSLFAAGPFRNGGSTISVSAPGEVTTISATGSLITGDHVKSLTATTAGQYFLVGNPYASPYDPKTFTATGTVNRANLDGFLWIWDAKPGNTENRGLGRYVSFDIDNQRFSVTGYGVADHNVMIQSGQAFFVRVTAPGAAELTFRESNKGSADANSMLGDGIQSARSWLEVTLQTPSGDSTLNEDGAVAFFYEGGNSAVDGRDGRKLMNGSENIYFRREDKNLTFEHRPPVMTKDTMYLRMGNMKQQGYRLQLKASELGVSEAYLIDAYVKKEMSISGNGTTDYDFTVGADSLSTGDRFRVVFAKAAAPVVVEPDGPSGNSGLKMYPNPVRDRLRVAVGVSVSGPFTAAVFNAAGVEVWKKPGIAAGTKTVDVSTSTLRSGVYTLVLTDAKGETWVEKFVKE